MSMTIKWSKESFPFEFPSLDTKLAVIRQFIADKTGLDYNNFKLIHAGAIMKDDQAPISAYHLTKKSTIHVVGSTDPPFKAPTSAAISQTEQSIVQQIQSELNNVRQTLRPEAQSFLAHLASDTKITTHMDKDHRRLGELLLQTLLRLDGINTDGEWENARRERKAAVKEVQALLDSIDNEWEKRK